MGTTTCTQIDLIKLFDGGFSTGHGTLREPNDIASYTALACIAIQSNQNDQHGGQSIVNFDYAMAIGVRKTFKRIYRQNLARAVMLLEGGRATRRAPSRPTSRKSRPRPACTPNWRTARPTLKQSSPSCWSTTAGRGRRCASARSSPTRGRCKETDRATYQAMEALIHNLNTMHSRAGAQTPFSSINYGMDTSPEGRMVMKNVLLATEAGLGNGETPIFPIQIFRVKEGVNYNPGEPNYDLFQLAIRCSAKRLFPNFSFIDAPFNLQYYKPGHPETEIAYMGCRTRVIGNVCDPDREICNGRGNLSFTTINLPRLAIKAKGDLNAFFEGLDRMMDLCVDQLLERFEIQCRKKVQNYPFLMGQGVWLDSRQAGLGRRGPGGPEARHPVRGLHRPGRDPEGPHRRAPRGEREGPGAGAGDHRPHAGPDGRGEQEARPELLPAGHPCRGALRPVREDGQGEVRRHRGGHRPGVLHELLPRAGVLSHLRL